MREPVIVGKLYVVQYPFVLEKVNLPDDDGGFSTVDRYRPGVSMESDGPYGLSEYSADGMGQRLLTVVDIHKPGRFHTRIFYTQKWKDPSGNLFGKATLRITTTQGFNRLLGEYRYPFYLD